MKFSSLCLLAYKRKDMMQQCLKSLLDTIDSPCEIIVNVDSSYDKELIDLIYKVCFKPGFISKLILSNGDNRGVGRSFQNCLGVAEGDYIFKIDTDLIFKPGWLSTAINILDVHQDVGTVSLFNYRHYDEADSRFNILQDRNDCYIVDDFVSSIFGFRKTDSLPKNIPDDGLHQILGGKLAITKEDYVTNSGFGPDFSTYIQRQGNEIIKTPTFDTPLIYGKDKEHK